jgi:hypothetical protein
LWRNLAAVHRNLGEQQLAELARIEAERAAHRGPGNRTASRLDTGGGLVRWVAPEVLARGIGGDAAVSQARPH